MREQRILAELGLHVSMTIAPGAAAKEHPCGLTNRAVVHRPGESLGVKCIDQNVEEGTWAVFRSSGPHPAVLQQTWAATATEWFPSNPWQLRPGPSIVAVLERADDFSTATTELWLPVERHPLG